MDTFPASRNGSASGGPAPPTPPPYQRPRAARTNDHKQGGLKQEESVLTLLEARCPKLRHWQGHAQSKVPRRGAFSASPSLLVLAGSPWYSFVQGDTTPVSVSLVTWTSSLCVFTWLSYEDNSLWLQGPPKSSITSSELIPSADYFQTTAHLKDQGSGFEHTLCGEHNSTRNSLLALCFFFISASGFGGKKTLERWPRIFVGSWDLGTTQGVSPALPAV